MEDTHTCTQTLLTELITQVSFMVLLLHINAILLILVSFFYGYMGVAALISDEALKMRGAVCWTHSLHAVSPSIDPLSHPSPRCKTK